MIIRSIIFGSVLLVRYDSNTDGKVSNIEKNKAKVVKHLQNIEKENEKKIKLKNRKTRHYTHVSLLQVKIIECSHAEKKVDGKF